MWRSFLKKVMVVCALLCIIYCTCAMADSETKMVDCKYLKGMNLSADSWYSLDITREYFVTAMVLDCLNEWTASEKRIAEEALAYNTLYISKDGNSINVFAFGKNSFMLFRYNTETENGFYSSASIENVHLMTDKYMDALGKQYNFSSYYKVDKEEVLKKMDSVTK